MPLRVMNIVTRWALAVAMAACGWFALACSAFGAELGIEVIELRYRTVEQVLPILQPLVPKPGTVSGMHSSLVVRTTPGNLAEIRRVLEAIDRVPRRLMITVRQDADASRADDGFSVSGSIGTPRARSRCPMATGTVSALPFSQDVMTTACVPGSTALSRSKTTGPLSNSRCSRATKR